MVTRDLALFASPLNYLRKNSMSVVQLSLKVNPRAFRRLHHSSNEGMSNEYDTLETVIFNQLIFHENL